MLEYLSSCCLLVNYTARKMHTYAVKLVLHNFRLLILHTQIGVVTGPLPEFEHWGDGRSISGFTQAVNHQLPDLSLSKTDVKTIHVANKWIKFLADPESRTKEDQFYGAKDINYAEIIECFD